MSTPQGATPIGGNYYLFKSSNSTPECLVSAHGGHNREQHFTVPAGVTLHFYALHGFTLQDPGVGLLHTNPTPKETITGGKKCHDYVLSKYQGRHSRRYETYQVISDKVSQIALAEEAAQVAYMPYAAKSDPDYRIVLARNEDEAAKPVNRVTVRNRVGSGVMKLSHLMRCCARITPSLKYSTVLSAGAL